MIEFTKEVSGPQGDKKTVTVPLEESHAARTLAYEAKMGVQCHKLKDPKLTFEYNEESGKGVIKGTGTTKSDQGNAPATSK